MNESGKPSDSDENERVEVGTVVEDMGDGYVRVRDKAGATWVLRFEIQRAPRRLGEDFIVAPDVKFTVQPGTPVTATRKELREIVIGNRYCTKPFSFKVQA